jgi:protein SSXT
MLDENNQLIQAIVDHQNKGKAQESIHYQNVLHRNLIYLASIADPSPNLQAVIPSPQSFQQINQQPLNHGPSSGKTCRF